MARHEEISGKENSFLRLGCSKLFCIGKLYMFFSYFIQRDQDRRNVFIASSIYESNDVNKIEIIFIPDNVLSLKKQNKNLSSDMYTVTEK